MTSLFTVKSKKTILLTLLLTAIFVFSGLTLGDENKEASAQSTKVGWVEEDDNWKYYKDSGQYAKSEWLWLEVEDSGVSNWKFFNSAGESMDQFWHENDDTWLSQAGPDTTYIKGWWSQNGIDYFFRESSGSRVKGWQYVDGAWRYFRDSGSMVKSRWEFLSVENADIKNWKFFNSAGESMDQFWNENDDTWLSQAGPDTTYVKGWWSQNDLNYFFRETSGSRVSGWQYIDDGWKFFRDSGSQTYGWQFINDQWFYLDTNTGNRANGLQEIGGLHYLFGDNGIFIEEISEEELANEKVSKVRQEIVDLAYSKVGSRYVWGTAGPNTFDCSGLAHYVYKEVTGIKLNRTSRYQAQEGTRISKSELQPGDLVFFYNSSYSQIGHVGIYVGDDKYVHAKGRNYGVVESTFNKANRYAWATRILDN